MGEGGSGKVYQQAVIITLAPAKTIALSVEGYARDYYNVDLNLNANLFVIVVRLKDTKDSFSKRIGTVIFMKCHLGFAHHFG